jgi:hypothetical protein
VSVPGRPARLALCVSLQAQMTQVDDSIKFGMIEAISHLIHRDYEAIVQVCACMCGAVCAYVHVHVPQTNASRTHCSATMQYLLRPLPCCRMTFVPLPCGSSSPHRTL